ncbi:MAG: AI-2E family transporter [Clostridia bacterium]|nr:AI-2E family transporter [Clostridia bacterium]
MTILDLFGRFLDIISPILYGVALSYLLSPILNFIEKKILRFPDKRSWLKSFKRVLSIILTFAVVLTLLAAAVSIFIPQIVDSYNRIASLFTQGNVIEKLDENLDQYIDKIISGNHLLEKGYAAIRQALELDEEQSLLYRLLEYLSDYLKTFFSKDALENLLNKAWGAGSAVVSFVVDAVVTFILCIYLLFTKEKQLGRMRKLVSAFFKQKTAEKINHVAFLTDERVGRYLRVQVLDSIMVGIVSYFVFMIADLPFYPVLALISGVTNIIPYFGPFIGAIPNGVFILLSDPSKLLPFIIIVLVIQQIDGNILVPLMQSSNMKMDVFWVLVGMTIMGGIFGLPGMILGVPLFSVIYILVKERAEEKLKEKDLPTNTDYYAAIKSPPKKGELPPFLSKIGSIFSKKERKAKKGKKQEQSVEQPDVEQSVEQPLPEEPGDQSSPEKEQDAALEKQSGKPTPEKPSKAPKKAGKKKSKKGKK